MHDTKMFIALILFDIISIYGNIYFILNLSAIYYFAYFYALSLLIIVVSALTIFLGYLWKHS